MGFGAINSINPFTKAYGASIYAGSSVSPAQSTSIFSQNNHNNNSNTSSASIDKNSSIFDTKINNLQVTGLNPFASVNKTSKAVSGVSPVGAKDNYQNGLAPSSDLQNVFAGNYKGKANILNQIAIA